jgi:RNA polymerase sigma factor (TIGR02999 family)
MSQRPTPDLDPADLEDAYARLRRIAQRLLAREREDHTLSATDVVHEALSKLLSAGWSYTVDEKRSYTDFVTHAARAMTEVLIDYSRRHKAAKRGGGRAKVNLDGMKDIEATIEEPNFDWAALHGALEELERLEPRKHKVVVLRFFGGLNAAQVAQQLDLDERTVARDWSAARLWLKEKLSARVPGDH